MTVSESGRRILITRQFDHRDIIGYIQLRPGVEIAPAMYIAFSFLLSGDTPETSEYVVLEGAALVYDPVSPGNQEEVNREQ